MPLAAEMRGAEMAEVISVVLAAHVAALVVVQVASVAVALVDSDDDVVGLEKTKKERFRSFFCLYKVEAAAYLVLQT